MKKKNEVKEEGESKAEVLVKVIEPITTDFGREDLNVLRDTLNEIIKQR